MFHLQPVFDLSMTLLETKVPLKHICKPASISNTVPIMCSTPTACYCAPVWQDNVGLSKKQLQKEWKAFQNRINIIITLCLFSQKCKLCIVPAAGSLKKWETLEEKHGGLAKSKQKGCKGSDGKGEVGKLSSVRWWFVEVGCCVQRGQSMCVFWSG